jgi:glycosyltransferase involved in cell wall biosynthesis
MGSERTSASIVIPAFNEADRIGQTLHAIAEYARTSATALDVIVVDDGSSDATATVASKSLAEARHLPSQVLRYPANRGKGYAVRYGLLAARAPIAVFSDADLSTPITELPKLLADIVWGDADVTFGSRALDRSLIGVHQPRQRELGGRAFNAVLRLATGLPFWDTQWVQGFSYERVPALVEAGRSTASASTSSFSMKRIVLACGCADPHLDHREGSKVNFLRDGSRMLRDVISVRRRGAVGLRHRHTPPA